MTVAILLPAMAASYLGILPVGMAISLGAFCVSLTDAPGPAIHRRNGMLACAFLIFVVALITAFARTNMWLLGLEITVFSFVFSMFNVYGNRATAIGNAALLVIILTMDDPAANDNVFLHSLLILGGGIWYMLISLAMHTIQPYRPAQRVLGECLREIALYMSIKADFYNPKTDLQNDYKRLVAQQVIVNEKQDAVREMFFKTRRIVRESTSTGRKLVLAFVESVDIFEDVTASYYDYAQLRERFADTGLLEKTSVMIKQMASELDRVGMAIQLNTYYKRSINLEEQLVLLKSEMDAVGREGTNPLVLKKILVNLRRLVQRFGDLEQYFSGEVKKRDPAGPANHAQFVSHQPIDVKLLLSNLTWNSAIFKHALRVSIACTVGFVVVNLIEYGRHSYWILLTIAFILKPAFSLTKQRNKERIIGTLIGGAVGVLILVFIQDRTILFILLVLFMLANYTALRINYLAMVMFATPFVLILFSFMGWNFRDLAEERLLDTVIGCEIAFTAGYFLFPSWEREVLNQHIEDMLRANAAYLRKVTEILAGASVSIVDYKLVRKEVYVRTANLSATFQRMLSEPKKEQGNSKALHQFVVLNHILFSNIATVASTLLNKERKPRSHLILATAQRSLGILQSTAKKINGNGDRQPEHFHVANSGIALSDHDDLLLKDQLDFIFRLSQDLDKTVDRLITR